jgi:hypothetical protein
MKTKRVVEIFLASTLFVLTSSTLSAQETQRQQDADAQRAYQASADEYKDVEREATTYKDAAEVIEKVAEVVVEAASKSVEEP